MWKTLQFLGLASALALGTALLAPVEAQAHDPYYRGYGYSYYGMGRHDFVPHWHQTSTPYGSYSWYGLGAHDFVPHYHTRTPYTYRGYSATPWSYTQSYYSPYPVYANYGPYWR
jgi:hypothetical protein